MGAGNSGLFKGTHGANKAFNSSVKEIHKENNVITHTNKPISKRGDVRYSAKKIQGYLLNTNHPKGGPKAVFMRDVLGYTNKDSKTFHNNVVKAIINREPNNTIQTQYGIKHTYHTSLIGKSGNSVSANVVVIVQKDKKRITYKIVTVYPDKKEK